MFISHYHIYYITYLTSNLNLTIIRLIIETSFHRTNYSRVTFPVLETPTPTIKPIKPKGQRKPKPIFSVRENQSDQNTPPTPLKKATTSTTTPLLRKWILT